MAGLGRRLAGAVLAGTGAGILQNAKQKRENTLLNLRRQWQVEDRQAGQAFQREMAAANQPLVPTVQDGQTVYTPRNQAAGMPVPSKPRATGAPVKAIGPDGKPMYVTPDQAIGMTPYEAKGGGDRKMYKDAEGYNRWVDNNERVNPGMVTPKDRERQEAKAKGEVAAKKRANIASTQIGAIRKAVGDQGFFSPVTGAGGHAMSMMPGSAAHDMSKRLDTLKAMIAFDSLQKMRDASPTGGALGQVSERELALLQATVASLEQSQSKEQFLQNLDIVEQTFGNVVHGSGGADRFARMTPTQLKAIKPEDIAKMSAAEIDAFERAYQAAGLVQ